VADCLEPLPKHGLGYFLHFWKLRLRYPDAYLLFTNSVRGDLEAWFTRCQQRFGLVRPGRRRPLLTHRYDVPADFDEDQHHQLELWENFLRAFGLATPSDRTPLTPYNLPFKTGTTIGLIAGSENNPEKRWPVAHWRTLIQQLMHEQPTTEFLLLGTANDQSITAAIAAGLDPARIHDLAGRTNLPAYVEKLRACRLLITNDTGGMHLANALGVPLVALFGPTNPVRTGPVFSAPIEILQPPGCPKTGGALLADLSPVTVSTAIARLLTPSS
jgi:ADP-heptose:LPS heptosyltransferase